MARFVFNQIRKVGPVFTIAFLAVGCLALIVAHSGGGSTLATYKAELRKQGEKLYLTELAIPPSTNADEIASRITFSSNSAPVFVHPVSSREFVGTGVARISWQDELHFDSDFFSPGESKASQAAGDWTAFERENQNNAVALEKFRQALEHPAPDTGWIYQDTLQNMRDGPPKTIYTERSAAWALLNSELINLRKDDVRAASADLHALIRLSQVNRNELTLVHQMVRMAITGVGIRATWEALQSPGWDAQSLALLQQDWEKVDVYGGLERCLLGVRAYGQVAMKVVRQADGQEFLKIIPDTYRPLSLKADIPLLTRVWNQSFVPAAYKLTGADKDELLNLTFCTKMVNAARALKSNRPWPEINVELTNVMREFESTIGNDHFGRYAVSAFSIPNYTGTIRSAARHETERRLALLAIAIKRYELQHSRLPAGLDELTPELLAGPMMDPMSGKPFCYRLTQKNPGFVLYSVGENGKDDGGKGGTNMWDGPDVVWPTAAPKEASVNAR